MNSKSLVNEMFNNEESNNGNIYRSLQIDNDKIIKSAKYNLGYEGEFQLISEYDTTLKENNKNIPEEKSNDIIKSSIILDGENQCSSSIWSSFSSGISNLKNRFLYNPIISTNSVVYYNNLKYIRLFDQTFVDDEIKSKIVDMYMSTVILMTYRSNFVPINTSSRKEYTSDCGWGCMIRTSQMMLAKAILENKIFILINRELRMINENPKKYFLLIEESLINKIKLETKNSPN